MDSQNKNVRIVKANRLLQSKVGSGPVDEKKIARSQKLIDSNEVDFVPMALEYIQELEKELKKAKSDGGDTAATISELTAPVMQ